MKTLTYCGVLLLSVILVGTGLKSQNPEQPRTLLTSTVINGPSDLTKAQDADNRNPKQSISKPSATSPVPSPVPSADGSSLILGDKVITLGESLESLLEKLGTPGRIADTEYDFDYYVYNRSYLKLVFVAVKEDRIVGFYTDSIDFNYMGITPASDIHRVNQMLESSSSLAKTLTYHRDDLTANILMDEAGTGKVTGIYVLGNNVKEEGFDDTVIKNTALLNFDLVNSIRVRNGLSVLSWSSSAAKAARKHSIDMAEKDYFDHISPEGSKPGDRLLEAGISAQRVGENIIAGYGTAILSSHAWFNSPEHRKNILNSDFISLGVGFTYQKDSDYKTYMTQAFYR